VNCKKSHRWLPGYSDIQAWLISISKFVLVDFLEALMKNLAGFYTRLEFL
jgi:hypothetical protein